MQSLRFDRPDHNSSKQLASSATFARPFPAIRASTTRGGLRQCGQDSVTDHEQTSNDEPTRIHDNGGHLLEICSLLLPLRLRLRLLLLLLAAAVSGATGSYDPKAFCSKTTDVASCLRVYPTLPDDVAKSQDNEQLYTRLYDYCEVKIYEASSLAESMIATTTAADPVIIPTFFPRWKGTTLAKVTCDGPKPSSLTASRMVSDQWSLVSPVTFDRWPALLYFG
uniref:Uncharacterized protein n=1 Tax=Oryza barthii TaxID=65489 RepID=A0A0D3HJ54_9ORYZ